MTAFGENQVLALGTDGFESVFDVAHETWQRKPAIGGIHTAASLPDGRVVILNNGVVRGTDGRYRAPPTLTDVHTLMALPNGKLLAQDPLGVGEVEPDGSMTFASAPLRNADSVVAFDDETLVAGNRLQAPARITWHTGTSSLWSLPPKVRGVLPRARVADRLVFATAHDDKDAPFAAWIDGKTSAITLGDRLLQDPDMVVSLGEGRALVRVDIPQQDEHQYVFFVASANPPKLTRSKAPFPNAGVEATCRLESGAALVLSGPHDATADHAWVYRIDGATESLTDLGSFALMHAPRCTPRGDGRALVFDDAGRLLSVDPKRHLIEPVALTNPAIAASGQLFTDEDLLAFHAGRLFSARNHDRKATLLLSLPVPER
ncbi:MAG TPA: hypothetical protein VM580_30400 [Labilithrix sp.]|nr:hypothetical protein [Labilithrix sp.]